MTKPATISESVINTQPSAEHNLSDKTLIIFDWDGTLMDSIGLIVDSMHVAGEAHGFKTTDKAVKNIIGLSLMNGIKLRPMMSFTALSVVSNPCASPATCIESTIRPIESISVPSQSKIINVL